MNHAPDERSTTPGRSGSVPPALTRPRKDDMREVGIVAAMLLILSLGIGGYWMYQAQSDGPSRKDSTQATVSKGSWEKTGGPVSGTHAAKKHTPSAAPASTTAPGAGLSSNDPAIRLNVYFDFDRSTLNEVAKRMLKKQVDRMLAEEGWSVVIQGYTDKLGPVSYNQALGLRRAQAVKDQLMTLGVPEHSIQIAGIGEDGSVCRGNTVSCSKGKRRAHVQWSRVDQGVLTSAGAKQTPRTKSRSSTGGSKVVKGQEGDRPGKRHLTTAEVSK
jgi:peptidoglycan-associated lipoprotein